MMVWLAQGLIPIREIKSADGLNQALIFRRPDGKFGFVSERLEEIDGDLVWSPAGESGIYESFESAQRAALAELPWLYGLISS
jgi:hypothetical protein